jgi:hypothetical protein
LLQILRTNHLFQFNMNNIQKTKLEISLENFKIVSKASKMHRKA